MVGIGDVKTVFAFGYNMAIKFDTIILTVILVG